MQKEYFNILNYKELHFNDFGDRVAQLLHVELASPFTQWRNSNIRQEILIVNTHLLFPHDSTLSLVRLQQVSKHINVTSNLRSHTLVSHLELHLHIIFYFLQVYKILQYVESYQNDFQLKPMPIMLCG